MFSVLLLVSAECTPCTDAKPDCQCHCHSGGGTEGGGGGQQKAGAPDGSDAAPPAVPGVGKALVVSKGSSLDPADAKTPLLKPAAVPAQHRQPSLDDSGVVGDHDGADSTSIVLQPTSHAGTITKVGTIERQLVH